MDGLEQEFYLSGSGQPSVVGNGWLAYQNEMSDCVAQHEEVLVPVGQLDIGYGPGESVRAGVVPPRY